MRLRLDPNERVAIDLDGVAWTPSPEPGVERRLLERLGDELAIATSVVRFAAGARFGPHTHGRGESFLVLEGAFEDEHGSHPRGTYVRNPWGSRHAPSAPHGCTLFVKLRQLPADERERTCVRGLFETLKVRIGPHAVVPVFTSAAETNTLERWSPGLRHITTERDQVEELLVLEGSLVDDLGVHAAPSWLRTPLSVPIHRSTPGGCVVWRSLRPL